MRKKIIKTFIIGLSMFYLSTQAMAQWAEMINDSSIWYNPGYSYVSNGGFWNTPLAVCYGGNMYLGPNYYDCKGYVMFDIGNSSPWDMQIGMEGGSSGYGKLHLVTGRPATKRLTIDRYGNVGIGTESPACTLDVTGTIRATTAIYVGNITGADFVFDSDYNLMPLEEVEEHIKTKKHLPEIVSAKEMQENGLNMGDFQTKLLQKIEELTLYTIELNKRIKNLEKTNNK